ncbi:uncharacterized protein [Argopecten irradians]|uniref:uncharacterized protein n=1 Tax=Argopecten irradians TaxID=31199 RepID=UPI00370FEE2C
MSTEIHNSDAGPSPLAGSVVVAFSVWQFVIIVFTLGVGIVGIGRVIRVGCKNSITIVIFLLCGILHELYAIYILQTAKHSSPTDLTNEGCADFYFACLVAIVISLLVIVMSVLRKTFNTQRSKLVRYIALVYCAAVVSLAIKLKSSGSTDSTEHLPTLQLKSEFLYVTVCERDPYSDGLFTFLEYGTIYIPFVCLYLILYYSQKAKTAEQAMKFSELQCLPACQDGSEPFLCRMCSRMNPVLAVTLLYYMFALLLARPFYIVCSMVMETTYKDLLPNITITALYVFVAIYCSFDIHLFSKKSSPASSDDLTEALIEPCSTSSTKRLPNESQNYVGD